jgi:hypothetical protein
LFFTKKCSLVKTCPTTGNETCSGNGVCDEKSGKCNCNKYFEGIACDSNSLFVIV